MKRIPLALALFASAYCSHGIAQTKLTILYKHGNIKGSTEDYKKPNNPVKWSGKYVIDEFTINDSTTYYQPTETFEATDEFSMAAYKRTRKNKVLGKTFAPNTVYCNYAAGTTLEAIEWKDDTYFVKDTIPNRQQVWVLGDETKTVFGYPCKFAYTMKDDQIDMMVWYTENFKCSLSNNGDNSLPGTVLETYYPKSNTLITAIDLQIETSPIALNLKNAKPISQQEFSKVKKNKKG